MCKFISCGSVAMLAVLLTVDAFAAPPGGRGKYTPNRGPAINRAAVPKPYNIEKTNPAEKRQKQFPQMQPMRPSLPGASNYVGPRQGYHPNIKPFTPAWYAHHPRAWRAAHPYRYPAPVTWLGLSRWVGIETAPVIYDYSPDGSEEMVIAVEETQEPENPFEPRPIAADEQAANADAQWYPLGMFSLVPPGNSDGIAMLQLAIGKDGSIRGTYQDVMTDAVYPLRGSLDHKTQKVAWHVEANKEVVYETGLQNLTEPTTAVMVRFGDEKRQRWTIRRVEADETAPAVEAE